jgi:hypothetical protein
MICDCSTCESDKGGRGPCDGCCACKDTEIARLNDKLRDSEMLRFEVLDERDKSREQNAKLQAAISDMLTCNFTGEKCPECYGKARLLVSEGSNP